LGGVVGPNNESLESVDQYFHSMQSKTSDDVQKRLEFSHNEIKGIKTQMKEKEVLFAEHNDQFKIF